MTVEVQSRDTMDPTMVSGDLVQLVADLNIAAANGKQFAVVTEEGGPYGGGPVALEVRNITRMREVKENTDAFVS